jgi:excisionase family DNA binding protein
MISDFQRHAAAPARGLAVSRPPATVPRLALSVEQACAALSVSWDTWKAQIEPEVRIVRVGRRKLIPVAELERWLQEHAETTLERR